MPGWTSRAVRQDAGSPMSIYEVHLGSWRRVPEENNRRLTYREAAGALAQYARADALHARRAPADRGVSVRGVLGLPDDRVLRADVAVRHAAGLHVPRGRAAPGRHRRHPGLGPVALPVGRARPGLLRRHAPLRARRLETGLPAGLGQLRLQLRPPRGPQLPALLRPLLAGPIPRGRAARRRGRVHAPPRLLPQAGGVGPQQVRRLREPRRDHAPAAVQRGGRGAPPRRRHDRGGVHDVARRHAADLRRRASGST